MIAATALYVISFDKRRAYEENEGIVALSLRIWSFLTKRRAKYTRVRTVPPTAPMRAEEARVVDMSKQPRCIALHPKS